MEQIKEAVYLINDERYLHLRENGAGVGFATYNKVTGEPLESGQISEKNLPPDGRNAIPAARNWYLFELSDDDRKAIQQESVKILENIPQAGIGRRRIWEPETLPKDIRLINSHYDDLYRIPDGGVVQVDYPDGRSFTARLEHLDDYHFDMGGLGNVFHICQFAEVMERNHADFYPEIQTQDEQAAWELGGKGYLAIQSYEDGWDYTIYHSDYSVMDGGQLDAPELTIQEAREQILEAHHMEKGRRLLQDYDAVMDKVAEAEELSADHRPSTLEKLAELASDGTGFGYPIHIDEHTISDNMAHVAKEALYNSRNDKFIQAQTYRAIQETDALQELLLKALQVVLYILASNAEIVPNSEQSFITKRGATIKDKYSEIRKWDVGIRIGAAIRQKSASVEKGESIKTASGHSSPRPHMRRGHWHHYWTGPRNVSENRRLILKWLSPMAVAATPEDTPIVIHEIKNNS